MIISFPSFLEFSVYIIVVSKVTIDEIWRNYNLNSDAWSLDLDLVHYITKDLSENDKNGFASLFTLLDTDENGLVDSIEFMVVSGLLSSLNPLEKGGFMFSVMDFTSSKAITFDEVILLLKTITSGVEKICEGSTIPPISLQKLENLAYHMVDSGDGSGRMSYNRFLAMICANPILSSWAKAFSFHSPLHNISSPSPSPSPSFEIEAVMKRALSLGLLPHENVSGGLEEIENLMKELSPLPSDETPPPPVHSHPPPSKVDLSWVYGSSSGGECSHVKVVPSTSHIVYPFGRMAVFLHKSPPPPTNDEEAGDEEVPPPSQSYHMIHPSPIQCIATGERVAVTGSANLIVFWDLVLNQSIQAIHLPTSSNSRMIKTMDFSQDESLLLIVSSIENSPCDFVHYYDWNSETAQIPVFSTQAPSGSISDACFSTSNSMFATSSSSSSQHKSIRFWIKTASCPKLPTKYQSYVGLAEGREVSSISCLARSSSSDVIYSGHEDGQISIWEGRVLDRSSSSEFGNDTITSLVFNQQSGRLVSGNGRGMINIWSQNLDKMGNIDMRGTKAFDYSVSCLAVGTYDNLVVSTNGGEILELSLVGKEPVIDDGHVEEEGGGEDDGEENEDGGKHNERTIGDDLFGRPISLPHLSNNDFSKMNHKITSLAPKQGTSIFVTGGADGHLRIWDATQKSMIHDIPLETSISTICFSDDGTLLAACLGLGYDQPKEGTVTLFNTEDWSQVGEFELGIGGSMIFATFLTGSCDELIVSSSSGLVSSFTSKPQEGEDGEEGESSSLTWRLVSSFSLEDNSNCIALEVSGDNGYLNCNSEKNGIFIYSYPGFELQDLSSIIENEERGEDGEITTPQKTLGNLLGEIEWPKRQCWLSKGMSSAIGFGKAPPSNVSKSPHSSLVLSSDDIGRISVSTLGCSAKSQFGSSSQSHTFHDGRTLACFVGEESNMIVSVGCDDGVVTQSNVEIDEDVDSCVEDEGEDGDQEDEEEEDDEEKEIDNDPISSEEDDFTWIDGKAMEEDDRMEAFHLDDQKFLNHYSTGGSMENHPFFESLSHQLSTSMTEDFSSIKPWRQLIVPPTGEQCSILDMSLDSTTSPLSTDLRLDWVYGMNCRKLGTPIHYNVDGDIVYSAGSVGVVFNKSTWSQKHYSYHHNEVSALCMHPNSILAASGQTGREGIITVWNTQTLETVSAISLPSLHPLQSYRGISAMTFSSDGHYLAVAAQDQNHSIFVFDWSSQILIGSSPSGNSKVLTLSFSDDRNEFLSGGVKHFNIWKIGPTGGLSRSYGMFGSGTKKQDVICSVFLGEGDGRKWVLGASSGQALSVSCGTRKVSEVSSPHKKCIHSIAKTQVSNETDGSTTNLVITGGLDGFIKIFDSEDLSSEPINQVDVRDYKSSMNIFRGGIKHVSPSNDGKKLMVATNSCDVIEIRTDDGFNLTEEENDSIPLISGHFKGDLKGLCTNPLRDNFATVGEDKTIRIWEAETHKLLSSSSLPEKAHSITYSPNGHLIAVGLGDKEGDDTSCGVLIVSHLQQEIRPVHRAEDPEGCVSDLKFSPNGSVLVAASLDGNLYSYNSLDNFSHILTMDKHSSGVIGVDFSTDGEWIQSVDTSYENQFYNIESGDINIRGATQLRDEQWSTCTLPIGYSVQGIYHKFSETRDVTSCCRSYNKELLAVGDAFGRVKLFHYPSPTLHAPHNSYIGHGMKVGSVRFLYDDSYLISAGGDDNCIFQWKVSKDTITDEGEGDTWITHNNNQSVEDDSKGDGNEENKNNSTEWELDVISPSDPPLPSQELPPIPTLTYVVGSSLHLANEGSIGYNASGDIVYPSGRVAVINSDTQSYFTEHTSQITCLCLSDDGRFALSGELRENDESPVPVFVWDPNTGELIDSLPNRCTGSLVAAAFSSDSSSCAILSGQSTHAISVFYSYDKSWISPHFIATSPNTLKIVRGVTFTNRTDFQIASFGDSHINFWRIEAGNLMSRVGVFEEEEEEKDSEESPGFDLFKGVSCSVSIQKSGSSEKSTLISGTYSGHLLIWDSRFLERSINLYKNSMEFMNMNQNSNQPSVMSISRTSGSERIVVGFSNGLITIINSGLEIISSFFYVDRVIDIMNESFRYSTNNPGIHSVAHQHQWHEFGGVVIATDGGDIIEMSIDSGEGCLKFRGISSLSPTDCVFIQGSNMIATTSNDGFVRVWDQSQGILINEKKLGGLIPTSVCSTISGSTLIVGVNYQPSQGGDTTSPSLLILNSTTLDIEKKLCDVGSSVSCLNITPSGDVLSVGFETGEIVLYDIEEQTDEDNEMRKNLEISMGLQFAHKTSTSITGIDISSDGGSYLRYTTSLNELIHVSGSSGERIGAEDAKDCNWETNLTLMSFNVQGLWSETGPPVSCVTSSGKNMIVVGGYHKTGDVKIFGLPSKRNDQPSTGAGLHAGKMKTVKLSSDGAQMLSLGEHDRTLGVWKIDN